MLVSAFRSFERQDDLMPTYFLRDDSDLERSASIEQRIEEVVPDLIKIAKIEDIAHSSNTSQPEHSYVLVVRLSDNEDYLDPLIAMAHQNRDRLFFIVISEGISASDYKRLMRTEGADWASAAGAPQEVVEILAKRRIAAPVASNPVE